MCIDRLQRISVQGDDITMLFLLNTQADVLIFPLEYESSISPHCLKLHSGLQVTQAYNIIAQS